MQRFYHDAFLAVNNYGNTLLGLASSAPTCNVEMLPVFHFNLMSLSRRVLQIEKQVAELPCRIGPGESSLFGGTPVGGNRHFLQQFPILI